MSTVRQALQSALDKNGGTIPFDAFMGIALHHIEDGYYPRNVRTIGRHGDFTTVPQLTPALGEAIGRWLRREAKQRGWQQCNVIECGPGSGALAAEVTKSFGWLGKRKLDLHLVETSEPLRAAQQERVHGTWHPTIEEALAACEGRALIYHNEFFDAFPCRVFRNNGNLWTELHLQVTGGRLREVFLPPQLPLPASAIFTHHWPDQQRVEVFASIHRWMQAMAPYWHAGAMLSIDYGGKAEEIYRRRPAGTLRAYRNQERLQGESVYELLGRQDITADVNFEDLAMWAGELGWETSTLESLAEFAPDAPGADAFRCISFEKV